jgi:response regulator NasT
MSEHGSNIFVVDDDPVVLATLVMGLRGMGFNVEPASSGEEAIRKCILLKPDIVVLDINMPGMSGIEAARQIREKTGVPVLFLTAYDDPELVKQAIAEGGQGYLIKPIRVSQLAPAIEAAIARARDLVVLEGREKNLSQALEADRNINVAMGILMDHNHLGKDESFQALRERARSEGRKIADLAQEIIVRTELANSFDRVTPPYSNNHRKRAGTEPDRNPEK